MTLNLTVALHANDHHRKALISRWSLQGVEVTPVSLANGEMYSRVFDDNDLDVVEMSIARYARLCSEGRSRLVAVPYYFSRVFPFRYFYVRRDFVGDDLSALRGMRVGLSEFDHTGHTWARALMEDEFGVAPSDVRWICARRELERPPLKQDFQAPSGVSLHYADPDRTLSQMLLDGEIDVLLNPNVPSCFTRHPEHVKRLIPDIRAAELGYFAKTGICPIQHVLGIRRDLVAQNPHLATTLIQSLEKHIGTVRQIWPDDSTPGAPAVALSGLADKERASLETFLRHHHSQGMSREPLTLERFFGNQLPIAKAQ